MHGYRRHVRARRHGGYGQVFSEIKVGAVRFVCKYQHVVFVRKFHDRAQIRTDPVISGVVDENGFCVGVVFDGIL